MMLMETATSIVTLMFVPSFLVLVHGRIIREVPDPHPYTIEETLDSQMSPVDGDEYIPSHHGDGWNVDSLLPETYNRLVPPLSSTGQAVKVRIALNVTQLLSIKEDEQVRSREIRPQVARSRAILTTFQSFSVHAHMSQEWVDERIQFPPNFTGRTIGLDPTWREKIWTPDTYFHNAIDGKGISILIPSSNFLLHKGSRIEMVIRTVLTVTCHMDLRMFPHDSQNCNIVIVSCKD